MNSLDTCVSIFYDLNTFTMSSMRVNKRNVPGLKTVAAQCFTKMAWEERMSRSKNKIYYFNSETQQSVWEKPEGQEIIPLSVEAGQPIKASHILIKHKESRKPSSWLNVNYC